MLPLLLTLLFGADAAPAPPQPSIQPVRMSFSAFRQTIEVEVRDLPRETAREAIQAALAEVAEVERLADPDTDPGAVTGGIAFLNARAGAGPQPIDPRLLNALDKALGFCVWSEQAHGPLGRDLYRLWGLRSPVEAPPTQKLELLEKAVRTAGCDRLRLDAQKGTAALAEGSAVDLWGFAEGWALDRAVEVLRQRGVRNGYVQLGAVHRGLGGGPDGRGWSVLPPAYPGLLNPLGRVFLRDRALAVLSATDRALGVPGETLPPYVSQRNGRPAQGVVAAIAVSDLAIDAQGLAAITMIIGPNEGLLRLGSLRPSPAVLWLLGSGSGEPLQVDYHWGEVPKR